MGRDYLRVRIDANPCSSDITDLVAAYLADIGFETFEPDDSGLYAFIPADIHTNIEDVIHHTLCDFPIPTAFHVHSEYIQGKDWNEEWEKNYFQPIVIEGECVIHSSFHTDIPKARYDIVIDPKMAFGTGHHHTTSRMAAWILEEDLDGKSLIDMGTGTGILAILASMRGATPVTGIEIDPDAYKNAIENINLNKQNITLICGDASNLADVEKADFLLANINRNIILADIYRYADALKEHATILLSGFYDIDLPMIQETVSKLGFSFAGLKESNHWVAAKFTR